MTPEAQPTDPHKKDTIERTGDTCPFVDPAQPELVAAEESTDVVAEIEANAGAHAGADAGCGERIKSCKGTPASADVLPTEQRRRDTNDSSESGVNAGGGGVQPSQELDTIECATAPPEKPDRAKQPSAARMGVLVAVLTVLSKFAGLARDVFIAQEYGTSLIADAFNYAQLFTVNVLVLFGGLGGPFHSSTVSIVTPQKDKRESGLLISQIMGITILVLTAITAIAFVAAPLLMHYWHYAATIVTATLSGGGQASLQAANELRMSQNEVLFQKQFLEQYNIMLPLIVISGIVGVSYGVLNVYNKIFWPSLSPAIASIAIIISIAVTDPRYRLITGVPLAVGALAGAIGQMLAQLPAMSRLPLDWKLVFKPQPGLKEYSRMLWPAVFSTSIGSLTVYVDSAFTGQLNTTGAWTAIVNSNRPVQLPLGILLTAMLVPILPIFTQQVAEKRTDDLKEELRRALRILWFLSLPMTAILLAIPKPIVDVLFRRGNFDESSSAIVTAALVWLTPMIVFYVARDLMTRVFYAFQDSVTPYKIAMVAIAVKAVLDWIFVSLFQSVEAISLATTLMSAFNLGALTFFLKRKIGNLGFRKLIKPLTIMSAATVACGGITCSLYYVGAGFVHNNWWPFKLAIISFASLAGMAAYFIICVASQLDEPILVARRLPVVKKFVRKA